VEAAGTTDLLYVRAITTATSRSTHSCRHIDARPSPWTDGRMWLEGAFFSRRIPSATASTRADVQCKYRRVHGREDRNGLALLSLALSRLLWCVELSALNVDAP